MKDACRGADDGSLASLFFRTANVFKAKGSPSYAQQRMLRMIAAEDGISQKEMQTRLAITPASLSELLNKLAEKGLVIRTRDENDRRRIRLSLTDKGRQAIDVLASAKDEELFAALNQEERAQLRQLLEKLERGMA